MNEIIIQMEMKTLIQEVPYTDKHLFLQVLLAGSGNIFF